MSSSTYPHFSDHKVLVVSKSGKPLPARQNWRASLFRSFSSRYLKRRRGRKCGAIPTALGEAESLETRQLLSAASWDNADHLTASIVPDGTDIAGRQSTFFSTFSSLGSPAKLQRIVSEVFQVWTRHAKLNVAFVTDGGNPVGTPGEVQADTRFGDIRIGAVSMSNDVLALAIPHSGTVAGTWSGEMLFNSSFVPVSVSQFKAVASHEIGHVFGLEHSNDPNSPMFHRNAPTSQSAPTQQDIDTLRSLHGARIDRHELDRPNDSIPEATRLRDFSFDGTVPLLKYGDLSTAGDVDFYQMDKIELYNGPVTFKLHVSGQSLVRVQLAVMDRDGNVLDSKKSYTPGRDISITIPNAPDETLYARVMPLNVLDGFSTGRYAIVATFDGLSTVGSARIKDVVAGNFDFLEQDGLTQLFLTGTAPEFENDLHLNDTIRTATSVKTTPGFDDSTHYEYFATLSDDVDLDFYSFRSPDTISGSTFLTVTIDAADSQLLQPSVAVYDRSFRYQSPKVLRNGNGTISVEIPDIEPNRTYFIKVRDSSDSSRYETGNYRFSARFRNTEEEQVTLLSGILGPAGPRQFIEMTLTQSMIFNLAMESLRGRNGPRPTVSTQFTLFDSNGNELHRVVTQNESTRTANSILLTAGTYYFRVNANAEDGGDFARTAFKILGSVISKPVGPIGTNPLDTPPPGGSIDTNVTFNPPTLEPPAILGDQGGNEDPFVYVPPPDPLHAFLDFEDWYWYYGSP
jgi:Matrixin